MWLHVLCACLYAGFDKKSGTVRYGAQGIKVGCKEIYYCIYNIDNIYDALEDPILLAHERDYTKYEGGCDHLRALATKSHVVILARATRKVSVLDIMVALMTNTSRHIIVNPVMWWASPQSTYM